MNFAEGGGIPRSWISENKHVSNKNKTKVCVTCHGRYGFDPLHRHL